MSALGVVGLALNLQAYSFKGVYEIDPSTPLYLMPRPMDEKANADACKRVEHIQKL